MGAGKFVPVGRVTFFASRCRIRAIQSFFGVKALYEATCLDAGHVLSRVRWVNKILFFEAYDREDVAYGLQPSAELASYLATG